MLSPTRFAFIGEERELRTADGWNHPEVARLWLYNLHYFDDLRADGAADRSAWHRQLIDRWIADNPVARGCGWEPYPTSLRIVNWIGWAYAGNDLGAAAVASLAAQARALDASLEFHLLGNHLLANAKALVFAGCFFSGPEAEGWLKTGLQLLDAQLPEQILSDGAHFELSPMYHGIILEDILDLIQLGALFPNELDARLPAWRNLAERMLAWLAAMTHPDGEIAFFNDAAFGIARTHADLARHAAAFGVTPRRASAPLQWMPASGYARLEAGPFLAIFDAAEIGPAYLPGHGHADTLSLEVSIDGQRLVTNSGTSTYQDDAVRHEERATAAHATVEIDGFSSSEVWASFRVGRRAHPFDAIMASSGESHSASASHDGYRWLRGKPVHRRSLVLSPSLLHIKDSITGTGQHAVVGRFPLSPLAGAVTRQPNGWRIEMAGGRVLRVHVDGAAQLVTEDGSYSPTFGRRMPRLVLVWKQNGCLPLTVETRFEL